MSMTKFEPAIAVLLICAVALAMMQTGHAQEEPTNGDKAISVLILTGQNNHNWRETTPAIENILKQKGKFSVSINRSPEKMTKQSLAKHNVIISNWNAFVDGGVKEWPVAARTALIDFVREGGGFVSIHGGSSSFYDWEAYQKLVITSWKEGVTDHGPRHTFEVKPLGDHPIVRDMQPFKINDELWHRAPLQTGAQVLATAFSSKKYEGTGEDEPMVVVRDFGKGRSVNILLGHDAQSMSVDSFQTLLARSVEWAATGKVTQPAQRVEWFRDDSHLALSANGQVLWQLNFGQDASKPYFHPVRTVGGPILTWEAPPDHPWHHGIWFCWKFINGVNFWEEDPETQRSPGINAWNHPEISTKPDGTARIVMNLRYEIDEGEPLLTENRRITVSPPDSQGDYRIDWTSEFEAKAPQVILDRTPILGEPDGVEWGGYAGLSVRFAEEMTAAQINTEHGLVDPEGDTFTFQGSAADYSGNFQDAAYGIFILQCPGNPPAPFYAFVDPETPFYFLSAALLYPGKMTLSKGDRLSLQYSIHVHKSRWKGKQLRSVLEQTM